MLKHFWKLFLLSLIGLLLQGTTTPVSAHPVEAPAVKKFVGSSVRMHDAGRTKPEQKLFAVRTITSFLRQPSHDLFHRLTPEKSSVASSQDLLISTCRKFKGRLSYTAIGQILYPFHFFW